MGWHNTPKGISNEQLPNTGEESLAFLPAVAWMMLSAGLLSHAYVYKRKNDE